MRRAFAAVFAIANALVAACGSSKVPDLTVRPFDAGADVVDASIGPDAHDASPDADPTLGGPCVDDGQCDDGVVCTFDACDKTLSRCRNVPDDTRCDDGIYCNGRELCVAAHGCEAGPVVTCEDGDSCTIDRCVEASKSCAHAPRDQDGDGDPDTHCLPKRDCDDLDPTVSSQHSEVCGNHKDDNCNGQVDESPCVSANGDTCANAIALGGAGTYALTTAGANADYTESCGVTTPSARRDIVAAITVPAGGAKDLEVWATTSNAEVALALDAACGQAATELACASGSGATSVRARARSVAPGTYYAIVTTQAESPVELKVSLLDPTTRPTNEDCATAAPIPIGSAQTIAIIDPKKDLPSACAAGTGELTYALTLAAAADVRVFASTLAGSGMPVVGLRDAQCTAPSDELRCRTGSTLPLFARNLAAGDYVLSVAGTSSIDASVDIEISPPTASPPDETCSAPPAVSINATMPVDLSAQDDVIQDGCLTGSPAAAFDLPLAVASDVLLVGRFPLNEEGAVSLDAPACSASSRLACTVARSPVRASKRGVPAGDYRVVVTDTSGLGDSITALVRPAAPPTSVSGGDTCATVVDIPAGGGFLVGDTSSATADFDNPCNAPSATPGGAPDQVMRLTLAQSSRVVMSMAGSAFTTVLDVRQGGACPGAPLQNGCYVGFDAQKSFLDLELAAGTYFVIVDGYNNDKGVWNLDVRVLPP